MVKEAKTFWQKSKGLIGEKHPYPLLIKTRFGIHTFGLRFPIDVLILDTNHCVVVQKASLKPNRIFFWPPKWHIVLELPQGWIQKEKIAIGEKINML